MAQKPKISLVLADVDGTLVTEDKVLTKRAQAAVRRLHDAGIRFAITSGRPPKGMAMLFDPLRLETPIAGFNGGLFVKRDLSIIEQKTLPADVARQGDRADPRARSRCLGLSRQRLADHEAGRAARRARGLDGQVRAEGGGGFRRTCSTMWRRSSASATTSTRCRRCEADAQAAFGERATATRSQPYYLDVTHKDANKGAVVDYLSRHLDVPTEEIATLGDQPNDVLMFKRSGFSIAMGNASDQVKAQASADDRFLQRRGLRQGDGAFRSWRGRIRRRHERDDRTH